MAIDSRYKWCLGAILLIAMLLRLAYAIPQPTLSAFDNAGGGDSGWYLANGAGFFSGQEHGRIRGISFYNSTIDIPPFYILFTGFVQGFLGEHETIIAIRLAQCLASVASIYLACRIANAICRDRRAGLLVAGLATFHPAMVIEPTQIATESFYIFFLVMGLWLYIEHFLKPPGEQAPNDLHPTLALTLAALALGLATLTRGVFMLFPLCLIWHLALLGRRRRIINWRGKSLLLLTVYLAMISTWTLHNLVLWDRAIIVSDQLMPAIWRGAESRDGSPRENDALLLEGIENSTADDCEVDCKYRHPFELYLQRIREIALADPVGLLALRANELLYSILQPHGTTAFGNVSIMAAAREWVTQSRSLDGLLEIIQIEGFTIKLLTWIFHYIGIVLGLLGMFWSRRNWHNALPLIAFLGYTICIHFIVLALPRYLFPIEIVWLIFAGIAAIGLYDRWREKRHQPSV